MHDLLRLAFVFDLLCGLLRRVLVFGGFNLIRSGHDRGQFIIVAFDHGIACIGALRVLIFGQGRVQISGGRVDKVLCVLVFIILIRTKVLLIARNDRSNAAKLGGDAFAVAGRRGLLLRLQVLRDLFGLGLHIVLRNRLGDGLFFFNSLRLGNRFFFQTLGHLNRGGLCHLCLDVLGNLFLGNLRLGGR